MDIKDARIAELERDVEGLIGMVQNAVMLMHKNGLLAAVGGKVRLSDNTMRRLTAVTDGATIRFTE